MRTLLDQNVAIETWKELPKHLVTFEEVPPGDGSVSKKWYFHWNDRRIQYLSGVRWSAADQAAKGPADHGFRNGHFHWSDRRGVTFTVIL